nr:MAG: hypothetical protein DIU52_10290 [bacterium]
MARQRLGRLRQGQTLNTVELVHEAYLKLVDQTRAELANRAHFLALAARAMRFILCGPRACTSREEARRGCGECASPR